MLDTHMKLGVTEPDFLEKFFSPPKLGKCAKSSFLNILKNCVINFYWICSIMRIYNICCVPAQIPYLGKFWFLRYGPKCSQPIRLQDFLISHISRTNQWNTLHVDTNSHELKVDQKLFIWAWPEMGVASLVIGL